MTGSPAVWPTAPACQDLMKHRHILGAVWYYLDWHFFKVWQDGRCVWAGKFRCWFPFPALIKHLVRLKKFISEDYSCQASCLCPVDLLHLLETTGQLSGSYLQISLIRTLFMGQCVSAWCGTDWGSACTCYLPHDWLVWDCPVVSPSMPSIPELITSLNGPELNFRQDEKPGELMRL